MTIPTRIQRGRASLAAALSLTLALVALALAFATPVAAQSGPTHRLTVRVVVENRPLAGATVAAGDSVRVTGADGLASFVLPTGRYRVRVTRKEFRPHEQSIVLSADSTVTVAPLSVEEGEPLEEGHEEGEGHEEDESHGHGHDEELEALVVTATRSERRIEDVPVRVEVLGREEVEEKMLMTPGDVAMMLNETSGLRVQSTSPSLGGANVRVQGLRGRYTQVLADGLPLYGGQSGSLGLLQVPPMDLAQVEVLKGAASALYGGTALGGVVNLVSRRPAGDRELLLNATTLGGADAVGWSSGELSERWGYTLLAGLHRQESADVDDDRWADLPGYERAVVRPRLFWDDGAGRSVFVTAGVTVEDRDGGGRVPGGATFVEELRTRRADAGLVGRFVVAGDRLLAVRASGMAQSHRHRFGDARERDVHATWFGEASLGGTDGRHTWVVGAALQQERYEARDVEGFDFTFTTPSVFAQDELQAADWLALSASARLDRHGEYGTFLSPRVSALVRPGAGWTARASVGGGYYAPTPFTEETEAVGLGRLLPIAGLEAERARTASLDVGRAFGEVEVNATLFGSVVDDAVQFVPGEAGAPGRLVNAEGETRTWGTELLARWHGGPFHVTASHTWLRSREPVPGADARREVPLTPRHAAGIVGMWEAQGSRVGVELYYTGRQQLEDNPYRDRSRSYAILGLLLERRFGRARVFVNGENLTDARQTRYDPLVLPLRSAAGRWSTDLWAPAEGRVVNAGVRLDL